MVDLTDIFFFERRGGSCERLIKVISCSVNNSNNCLINIRRMQIISNILQN